LYAALCRQKQKQQQQQHLFIPKEITSKPLVLKLINKVLAAYSNHNGSEKLGSYL